MKGKLIRIYLKSGKMFAGIVKEWNEQFIDIIHKDEITRIIDLKSVDAYTINTSTSVDFKEDKPNIKTVEQKIETAKINAKQEKENIREHLLSNSITGEPAEYANQLSILRQIKNNTRK